MTVSVDGTVLERIAKIMTYLRLGSSGKVNLLMAEDKSEMLLVINVSFVTKNVFHAGLEEEEKREEETRKMKLNTRRPNEREIYELT